jgi:centrosomal protein CEP135
LIEETSKLRRYLDKSVTEATSAQQQVIITQRELAAATHRESILALRAEEAEESTIELKKRLNVLIEKSDAALTKKSPDVMDFPAADQHPDNAEYYNEAVVDIVLRGVMYEDEDESDAILLANKEIEILRAKNARLGHNLKDTEEAAATTAREIELESQLSTAHEKHAAIDAGFSVMDFNAGIKPQHADRFDGRRHVPDEGLDGRLRDLTLENASLRQNLAGTEEACKKMETELQRIQKEYHDLARSLSGSIDSDDVTVGRR